MRKVPIKAVRLARGGIRHVLYPFLDHARNAEAHAGVYEDLR